MTGFKFLVPLLLFALILAGCDKDKEDTPSRNWHIGPVINGVNSSVGVKMEGNSFTFPKCDLSKGVDGPSVHYVTKIATPPLRGEMGLLYEIQASPDAVFLAVDGLSEGRISLFFQRQGDDYSQAKYDQGFRWWSKLRVPLKVEEAYFYAKLEEENWIPVNSNPNAFYIAKDNALRVGFTFGGSGNAGHGVCLKSGTARFIIKEFSVNEI